MSQAESLLESRSGRDVPDTLLIGAVDYINTIPLIAGLERLERVEVRTDVPAKQVALLEEDTVDLALCSSVDLIRSQTPLRIVPVGMLGCEGPTLTVRLFSSVPILTVHRPCDVSRAVQEQRAQGELTRESANDAWAQVASMGGPAAPDAPRGASVADIFESGPSLQ